jgi:hypothetical protein
VKEKHKQQHYWHIVFHIMSCNHLAKGHHLCFVGYKSDALLSIFYVTEDYETVRPSSPQLLTVVTVHICGQTTDRAGS